MPQPEITDKTFDIEQVALSRFDFSTREVFTKESIEMGDIVSCHDRILDRVCFTFRASIYAHQMRGIEVEYPKNWWEHFKQRWFPAWALRRWPVQMEIKSWDVVEWDRELKLSNRRGSRTMVLAIPKHREVL